MSEEIESKKTSEPTKATPLKTEAKPASKKPITAEAKDALKKQRLAYERTEVEDLLSGFVKKATFTELDSLRAYVTAKNSTRDLGDRINNARALAPVTQEAINIMSTITIIDAILMDGEEQLLRAVRSRSDSLTEVLEAHNRFQDSLKEIQGQLMPLVDAACAKGLVRDRDVMNEYQARKALLNEFSKFNIDPSAVNARDLLKEAKEKKQKEERDALEAANKEKIRLKQEKEAEQKKKEEANKALMEALGIDANTKEAKDDLRKAKLEMKDHGIDPASKDAVKQLLKKREDSKASA